MNEEKIRLICSDLNINLNSDEINGLLLEYENSSKSEKEIRFEIMNKLKMFSHKNINNNLITYTVGKTTLNLFINMGELDNIINRIQKDFESEDLAFKIYQSYLNNSFINTLKSSVKIVLDNDNINKISFNDYFIKNNMKFFEKLGFIIKVLTDEELYTLFPNKTASEKELIRYYAYINKKEFLEIYSKTA